VVPIHGTGFVAVQMGAVARERYQVRHARLFYTAPSQSRLIGSWLSCRRDRELPNCNRVPTGRDREGAVVSPA
jgi:hypothetical protein